MEINLEEIRKQKLMVATPMYGGMATGFFMRSVLDLTNACNHYGIPLQFFSLFNESLISRARNYCADEFMRSDGTHLLFIDADIDFKPIDVLALLHISLQPGKENDIICGPYPKKNISWEKVKDAVDQGYADENPFILEKFTGDYVFSPVKGGEYSLQEPIQVREAGTGFMLIPRSAFELFNKTYPEHSYKPDHLRSKNFDGEREIFAYFQDPIENKRHLSEDYWFCYRMTDAGAKVWICPWMEINHTGSYTFKGSLGAIASINASVNADVDKVKGLKK